MAKTRSNAARLIGDGHVRVNSVRVEQASKAVKAGDVVTVALERTVRVLRVLGPGVRRGPAPEAERLYEDLAGPRPNEAEVWAPGSAPRREPDPEDGQTG